MVAAAAPIQWATLKYDPTEPRPSKAHPDWAPQQSSVAVLTDSTEQRIYFPEGQFSNLRKNDAVLLEYSKGKWRLAKTQTPELSALLAQRQQHTPEVAPPSNVTQMPQRTAAMPQAVAPKPSREQITGYISKSARLFQHCWNEAEGVLPATCSTDDVRSVATTLFIQAARKFSL